MKKCKKWEELLAELNELAQPLQEWLLRNYDAECEIKICARYAEVKRGEMSVLLPDADKKANNQIAEKG